MRRALRATGGNLATGRRLASGLAASFRPGCVVTGFSESYTSFFAHGGANSRRDGWARLAEGRAAPASFTLVVTPHENRAELPVVELRQAA